MGKIKMCQILNSGNGVKSFLFESGAVNKRMQVKDSEKFDKAIEELKEMAEKYSVFDDLVLLSESGIVTISGETLEKLQEDRYSEIVEMVPKPRPISAHNRTLMLEAMERLKSLVPGTKVLALSSYEIAEIYGEEEAHSKGFTTPDDSIVINIDQYTTDTPFHEFAHLGIKYIKESSPEEYALIVSKALEHETARSVREQYPELSEEELGEEIFVTQVGLRSAEVFTKSPEVGNVIKRFYKKIVGKLFGVYPDTVRSTDNINDMINKFSDKMLSDASIFNNMPDRHIQEILKSANSKYSDNAMYDQLIYSGYIKKMAGEEVYLDKNYRPSEVYDRAKRNGKSDKEAKNEYLRHMSNLVNLRFQKMSKKDFEDLIKSVDDDNDNLEITPDATGYRTKGAVTELFKRTTSFIDKFVNGFERDKMAMAKAMKDIRYQYEKQAFQSDTSSDPDELKRENAKETAQTKIDNLSDNAKNQLKDAVIKLWEFKRDEGTFIHQLAEDYINTRQKLSDAIAKDGKNGFILMRDFSVDKVNGIEVPVSDANLIAGILSSKPRVATSDDGTILKDDNDDNGKYSPANNAAIKENRNNYLRELETRLKSFEKERGGGRIIYRTEVKLKGKFGYAGSIDLLAFDVDKRTVHVIDHKTKERGADKKYWWKAKDGVQKLAGTFFKRFHNNAMIKASIQTSMYGLMLKDKGFKIGKAYVFYTEGDIDYDNGPTQYKNIEVSIEPLVNMQEEITSEFDEEGITVGEGSRESRNDIAKTMSNIFDDKDVDFYEPSDAYVRSRFATTTTQDVRGRMVEGWMWEKRFMPYSKYALSREQRMNDIQDKLSVRGKLTSLEEDVESLLHDPNAKLGGGVSSDNRRTNILRAMKGIHKDTHELIRLSSESDFGPKYVGIVMFKNKLTGEHRVVQLQAVAAGRLKFGDSNHTTVFGKYRANHRVDRMVRAHTRYHEDAMLSAKMVKVGMVIAKMRSMDPGFTVEYILATPPLAHLKQGNTDQAVIMYDMSTLMSITGKLMEDADKAGDLVGEMKDIFSDKTSFIADSYQVDFPTQLLDSILAGNNGFAGKKYLKESLLKYTQDPSVHIGHLVTALNDFIRINGGSIDDNLKRTVLRTILHLKGFRTAAITQDINSLEKYLTIPAHTANLYVNKMGDVARGNKTAARLKYIDYSTDHANAVKEFMGKSYNPARMGAPSEMKDLFRPIDHNHPEDMYRLKEDSALNSKQIAYKHFFQKQLKKALLLTETGENIEHDIDVYIAGGYVPLVSTSFKEKLMAATNSEERAQVTMGQLAQAAHDSTDAEDARFDMQSLFTGEVGTDMVQSSATRRLKLGIDADDKVTKGTAFEMNLETVLDRVMSESLMTHYGRETLAVGKALAMEQQYQYDNFGFEAKGLKDVLDLVSYVFVKGEMSNSIGDQIMGSASTLATYMAIAMSAKSMVLETVTNAANLVKLFIQEDLMAKLLNAESNFTGKDMLKAFKLMTVDGEKANLLMLHFGMKEANPKRLARFMSITEKGKIFKSDNLFAVQTAILSTAQMEVMIASMLHQGSYDAYYVKDGKLKYDEKKDGRFFPQDGSRRTDKQEALYEMHKLELAREGKIDKHGDMMMGYLDLELNKLKDYTVEAFSSMDDDSRNASTYSIFGRMVGKFKTWVLPRVARIIGAPAEERISSMSWNYIRDEDGKIIKVIPQFDPAEGYLYTIGKLANSVYQEKSLKELSEMSPFEREQLKKGLADSIMVMLLLVAYSSLTCDQAEKDGGNCWHKDSAAGAIVYQSLKDAPSDILVPITIWQTLTGNNAMAPSLAIGERTVMRVVTASGMMINGDIEEGMSHAVKSVTAAKHFANLVDEASEQLN